LTTTDVFKYDDLQWVHRLQKQLPVIQDELAELLSSSLGRMDDSDNPLHYWQSLRTRKGQAWSDDTGWAHIALIDNFRVNEDIATAMFPNTFNIVAESIGDRIGPRLVAIACQKAKSGIPKHCDYMNWMLTLHTALNDVGDGDGGCCGMVVDGIRKDWKVGEPVVMDTTFRHSTYNTSHKDDMYLLLVDFWHPDLSLDEIDAMRTFLAANSGV
jgi:aspartyl/asparaginyl beta-hydroxylase (cupin superfamily)